MSTCLYEGVMRRSMGKGEGLYECVDWGSSNSGEGACRVSL